MGKMIQFVDAEIIAKTGAVFSDLYRYKSERGESAKTL